MSNDKIRRKRKSKALVLGYLEKVSSKIFSDFPKQLTNLVGKQHGVYALYKGKRLYYVGLATNLRSRIKQHLKDKHSGKWDKFSLYLVHKADHIKELETIVMRIANPDGNTASGRLHRADNLKADLLLRIKAEQGRQLDGILGGKGVTKLKKKTPRRKTDKTSDAKLQPLLNTLKRMGLESEGNTRERYFELKCIEVVRSHLMGTYTQLRLELARLLAREVLMVGRFGAIEIKRVNG